jgi:argininosuccinate lyase
MIREGRLSEKIDKEVASYVASIDFDINILTYDLLNNMAHVVMLAEQQIIKGDEAGIMLKGLMQLYETRNAIKLEGAEDVHLAIEKILTEKIGELAGKVHTARSRNDQIACDLRMLLRKEINFLCSLIIEFESILLEKAAKHVNTVMPGYTHLQRGQPTTLGHHLVAHADAVLRDLNRFEDAYKRINLNPLGAGAFATTSFPIDRKRTTQLLGFDGLIENSMDAVAARDFILESQSCISILLSNISKLADEIVLWTSSEFGFMELSDDIATTSSIMPQKKNPDALELMRARAGRVFGNLVSSMSILKSLPMSYNRDLQELNPLVIDSIDIAKRSLVILGKAIRGLKINEERMMEVCDNFTTATDLADLIAREKKIPFRTAHRIVGALVARAVGKGIKEKDIDSKMLDDVAMSLIGTRLKLREESIRKALSPTEAVKSRVVSGGPAAIEVKRMIASRKRELVRRRADLNNRIKRIERAEKLLLSTVDKLI